MCEQLSKATDVSQPAGELSHQMMRDIEEIFTEGTYCMHV